MQLFKSVNQECLFEGMKAIFEHIGGVPTTIWFDNMSTVVKKIKEYGERDLTKGFLRFMMHYGFQSNFCNPNSGHEKGSVENKVGYHRRNMLVPIPEFNDLKEYNKELLLKCDQDMNRMHYKGYGMIKDLFQEDKQEFFKLPKVPFEVYIHEFAKTDNYGKVKFDGSKDNLPKKPMSPVWILISILGGVIIALIITGVMKSSLKSVSKQRVASNYIVSTVMSLYANQDLYLYSVVTKKAKPKESEGSSGTHKSSSGRTHGGSSGKF